MIHLYQVGDPDVSEVVKDGVVRRYKVYSRSESGAVLAEVDSDEE